MSGKLYTVNEVFYSLQGEGVRSGTANVFIRFAGCNLQCRQEAGPKSPGGFDCDTEFASGRRVSGEELVGWAMEELRAGQGESDGGEMPWIVWTGGEPGLQLDRELIALMRAQGFRQAIETNGSIELPPGLDWITVSPKVAEHAIRQRMAHEVKYVRGAGQALPKTAVTAKHYLLSPAFDGLQVCPRALAWCVKLVKENPQWRLSMQSHKFLSLR